MPHFCGHTHARHGHYDSSVPGGGRQPDSIPARDGGPGSGTAKATVGTEVSAPTHRQIAELAYSYWEARGGQGGSALEDWLRAERELKRRRRL